MTKKQQILKADLLAHGPNTRLALVKFNNSRSFETTRNIESFVSGNSARRLSAGSVRGWRESPTSGAGSKDRGKTTSHSSGDKPPVVFNLG